MRECDNLPAEVAGLLQAEPSLVIEGGRRPGRGSQTTAIHDPSTGEAIARAVNADPQDVDDAVQSAYRAHRDARWRGLRPVERERTLLRWADLLEQKQETFAQLETLEQGKSIALSRMLEAGGAVDWLRFAAGLTTKLSGRTFDTSLPGSPEDWTSFTIREPVGVVAAIAPWNFPLLIGMWKVAPALAAGCTVVLKPSEFTPLTALLLAETALEAGLPPGVFNVVTGEGAAGRAMVEHPLVAKVTFTGSIATGRAVGRSAVDGLKRLTLELGGKGPAIVLKDADLASVVPGLAIAAFLNSGQVCAAATRVYAEEGVFDDLVDAVSAAVADMSVGPGRDPSNQITPVVSAQHQAKVRGYVDEVRAAGGTIRLGRETPSSGYYVQPAVVVDPNDDWPVMKEEIFGPVLGIRRVQGRDQALGLANDSSTGLTASIWTRDVSDAMRMSRQLQGGTVWVNSHVFIDPAMPFGGVKQSGIGRDFGKDWLDNFTEDKAICIHHPVT